METMRYHKQPCHSVEYDIGKIPQPHILGAPPVHKLKSEVDNNNDFNKENDGVPGTMTLASFALDAYNGGICRFEKQEIATKMARIEHLCFVLEESGDNSFHNTQAINSVFLLSTLADSFLSEQ